MEKEKLYYLQIDFLRLFRLSRNLKYINKKRKMPSECNGDESNALKCCNSLLRVFIMKTFNTDYVVKKHRLFMFELKIPETIFIKKFIYKNFNSYISEKIKIFLHTDFILFKNDWHQISPTGFIEYRNNNFRPMTRFFEAALNILEYKKNMDELIKEFKKIELKDDKQYTEEYLSSPYIELPNFKTISPVIHETEVKINSEQFKFNEALRKYIGRKTIWESQ